MITISLPRQYVEVIRNNFFPDINLFKQTRLHNVENFSVISEAYMSALVINCVLEEIEQLLTKKLINTTGRQIKIALTDAQGIVLYKTLIALPIPADHVYYQLLRNMVLQLLDAQLANLPIHLTAKRAVSTG